MLSLVQVADERDWEEHLADAVPVEGQRAGKVLAAEAGVGDAVAAAGSYEFAGHDWCKDARGQSYEQWDLKATERLYYTGDISKCSCPECRRVCDQLPGCLGFDYYCCPEGERCIAGASVLFGKGTRPSTAPPAGFGAQDPYGGDLVGKSYSGTGPIAEVEGNPDAFCYRKKA